MQLSDEGGLVTTRRPFQDFSEATLESAAPVLPSAVLPAQELGVAFDEEEDLDRDTIPSPPPFL